MKVPAIIASSVICLALGMALGVGAMLLFGENFGYYYDPHAAKAGAAAPGGDDAKARMPAGGKGGPPGFAGKGPPGGKGGPPGGFGGKGGGKGGKGGFKEPSNRAQLANLVNKLDLLARQPSLKLDDAQKSKVLELLKGLEEPEELADDDAKKRLDGLLEIVEKEKATMEAVGFRWPGSGFQLPVDEPNPFKAEANRASLQSLQKQLGKSK